MAISRHVKKRNIFDKLWLVFSLKDQDFLLVEK